MHKSRFYTHLHQGSCALHLQESILLAYPIGPVENNTRFEFCIQRQNYNPEL